MPARGQSQTGQLAEQAAAQYLIDAGMALLERNFRCRAGEIDLIFLDAQTLVFVEVRMRRSERFGSALASVDCHKQRRLYRAACAYVASRAVAQRTPMRFDVIAVSGQPPLACHFEWVKDAFQFD